MTDLLERLQRKAEETPPARCQVKFWCPPDIYESFTKKCDELEYKYAPTFIEFMKWFVEEK